MTLSTNKEQDRKISILVSELDKRPKIAVLDLGGFAINWSKEPQGIAMRAVDITVESLNKDGFLIFDKTQIIGDAGNVNIVLPDPDEMRKRLKKNNN